LLLELEDTVINTVNQSEFGFYEIDVFSIEFEGIVNIQVSKQLFFLGMDNNKFTQLI